MTGLKSKVERLEKEYRFRRWFHFQRFLEGLTGEQLEIYARHGRLPEPLPEPLPMGASRLDGLDRKSLTKLWEETERWYAGRSRGECDFYAIHGHWPEQSCEERNCQEPRAGGAA